MSNPKDYVPHPVDTSSIQNVDQDILELLAKNTHEVWAKQRIEDGWTYGEHKDEIKKTTPLLIPYEELSDEEKQYDRNTAEQALKVMMAAGIPLELSPEIRENLKGMFLTGEEKAVWEQDRQNRELARQKNEQYDRILEKSESPYLISAYYSDPDWKRHGDSYSLYPYSEVLDSAESLEEGLIKLQETAARWNNFPDDWKEDETFQSQMFYLSQQERFGGYHILANDFCTLEQDGSFSVEPVKFLHGVPEENREQVAALRNTHPELFAMTAEEQKIYDWAAADVQNFQKKQTQTLQASGQRFGVFLENDSHLAEFTGLWPEEEQPLLAQEFQVSAGDLNTALQTLHQFGADGTLPQESYREIRHWSVCMIQNDPKTGEPVLEPVAHFDRQGVRTENNIWRETTSGIQWDNTDLLSSSEKEQIPQIQSAHPEWFAQSTTRTPVRRNPAREEQVKKDRDQQPDEKLTNLREQEEEIPF